jgi:hypothetical protein
VSEDDVQWAKFSETALNHSNFRVAGSFESHPTSARVRATGLVPAFETNSKTHFSPN